MSNLPTLRYGPDVPKRVTLAPVHTYKYHAGNYNANVNNLAFIQNLIGLIEKNVGHVLSGNEKTFILTKVKTIDPHLLTEQPLDILMPALVDIMIKKLRDGYGSIQGASSQLENIDMHELMKSQIGTTEEQETEYTFKLKKEGLDGGSGGDITSILGISDAPSLVKSLNPQAKLRQNYIIFDSRYRIPTIGTITEYAWDFIATLTSNPGTVNIYGIIRDIVAMRVYPIRIPYTLDADTEQQRLSLNIKEFSPQGFVAHENRRFHFMFNTVVDGRWINGNPFNFNDGYYRCHKAVVKLDKLSLTFGNPLANVTFDADRDNYTMVYGALTTTVTTSNAHNLITGDVVYFEDFITTAPAADATIIKNINSPTGFHITFISLVSFTIVADTSTASPIPGTFRPTVYFGSKRFYVPIELTYIDPS